MTDDSSVRILKFLNADQRTELKALGTPVRYPPDHTIFFEGQPSHSALLINEGHLKVTRVAADGKETILAIRGTDELMGEEGVLMEEPRSATVTTITDVAGVDIAAADLYGFVRDNDLWPLMYRAAVKRGRQSDQRFLREPLNVKSRLALWLLELAREVGEPGEDGVVIGTTLSQQDLASKIGASRDAVAIALRALREAGVLSTARNRIVLHNLEALRQQLVPQIEGAP
ncbi:Crp/Fnr family transcriptional regulator [Lentzea tibetensis]|uniref:Crp/Fnr family transcriptional regulator n=1 Tax=Lentzea tibetensis TaxID=2591470 RepID=A0A563F3B9_9PSEU|nr:Crp/Fnr family transcriptional regulator [Lentzea tibetensis]TWP54258.1 Crp/Fnr family transcriptional regulator [Lentzea tibetensis]